MKILLNIQTKKNALNLLLLIEKNNEGKNLKKKIIFNDDILPIFLIDEVNAPSNIDKEKDKEKENSTKNENDKKEVDDLTPGNNKVEEKETILKEIKKVRSKIKSISIKIIWSH